MSSTDKGIEQILEEMTQWVRQETEILVKDYWDAYYSRKDECKKAGQKMDWHAGCRMRETKSGARIRWL